MTDDARTALSDRLERFVKGRWVPEDGPPRDMLVEVIAALRTPAPDLRAVSAAWRELGRKLRAKESIMYGRPDLADGYFICADALDATLAAMETS